MTIQMQNYSKSENFNALIIILYIYQYGLLLPINTMIGTQSPIIFFTLILTTHVLLNKKGRLRIATLFLFLIPLNLLLIKLPFEYNISDGNIAMEMLLSFSTIGLSGILIGTLNFSYERFLHYGLKIGWVNFLFLFLYPFTSHYNEYVNYMRFGYTLLPSAIFSFYFIIKRKGGKFYPMILFVSSLVELTLFGARGSLLTLIIFILLYVYIISNINKMTKLYLTVFMAIIIINLPFLLNYAIKLTTAFDVHSYSVTKYLSLFADDQSLALTSSGRDSIYASGITRIAESPWFGSPINSSFYDTGASYYHNIILDIIVNFGFLLFFVFIAYIISYAYKAIKSKNEIYRLIFLILLIIPMGRLFVSSSFWQRPEFWLFMSFCINHSNIRVFPARLRNCEKNSTRFVLGR